MSTVQVTRWIRGYDKVRGNLLVEYPLVKSWSLDDLQRLFGRPADDPMYHCYPIDEKQALKIGVPLGDDFVEFFLEADAEE